jgi:hypothetical protein
MAQEKNHLRGCYHYGFSEIGRKSCEAEDDKRG